MASYTLDKLPPLTKARRARLKALATHQRDPRNGGGTVEERPECRAIFYSTADSLAKHWVRVYSSSRRSPLIYLASVTDARYLHQRLCVVDGVHRAVITNANAPLAITAL
jgi:hypothetical protein